MKNNLSFVMLMLCIGILLLGENLFCRADTIILKDGRRIEGVILAEKQDSFEVKLRIGTMKIDKAMIQKVEKLSREENLLNTGNRCFESGNYDSALEEYKKALEINQEFQPAKDAIAKIEGIEKGIEDEKAARLQREEKELQERKADIERDFGFKIEFTGSQPKAISIDADGAGEAAGLQKDDLIVQVSNRPTKDKSQKEIINSLFESKNSPCFFTIQREVKLTRKKIDYQKHAFIGVGIFLELSGNDLVINNVVPGESADLAGLMPKDKVTSIDGSTTDGLSVSDASKLMTGAELSAATLVIQRSMEIKIK